MYVCTKNGIINLKIIFWDTYRYRYLLYYVDHCVYSHVYILKKGQFQKVNVLDVEFSGVRSIPHALAINAKNLNCLFT